jgi:ABC-2 type transport system permease protein
MSSAVSSGTLDTLLSVPVSPVTIFAGLTSYGYVWTLVRSAVTIIAGVLLGANLVWERLPAALLILVMIILAYLPFGLMAAAMVVAFRTPGPLGAGVLLATNLLGGVYYPTHLIPSWIQKLSVVIPLTYGLRALRRVVLDGASLASVGSDLGMLALFIVVLSAVGTALLMWAFRYARRAGTLSQY